jgi:hypothetical protein
MGLIVIGVIFVLAGVSSIVFGVVFNNNPSAQFYGLLETGAANPGIIYMIIGILCVIFGVVILFYGTNMD